MPADQLKAMWAIENCRTGTLGGAVYACQQCGKAHSIARVVWEPSLPACQSDKVSCGSRNSLRGSYLVLTSSVLHSARVRSQDHASASQGVL